MSISESNLTNKNSVLHDALDNMTGLWVVRYVCCVGVGVGVAVALSVSVGVDVGVVVWVWV